MNTFRLILVNFYKPSIWVVDTGGLYSHDVYHPRSIRDIYFVVDIQVNKSKGIFRGALICIHSDTPRQSDIGFGHVV